MMIFRTSQSLLLATAVSIGCRSVSPSSPPTEPTEKPIAFHLCRPDIDITIKGPGLPDGGLTHRTDAGGAWGVNVPKSLGTFNLFLSAPGYPFYGHVITGGPIFYLPDCLPVEGLILPAWTPLARRGIVHPVGKAVADDDGLFHPLGLTFFWGLWGEKFERQRVLDHLTFIQRYRYDYLRILAEVGWPGEEMDPAWPDYEQQLGRLIDDIYDHGLRVEITVLGGGTGHDPMDVAAKVARVVNAGRTHKVIAIEAANESFKNGPDGPTLIAMGRYLRANTPNLIALSAGGDDVMRNVIGQSGATLVTLHIDRNGGDHKWRQVRQAWNFKDYSQVVASNEPPGPNSSVDTNDSPLQLALMRATSVLAGSAMYALHVGDMVTARVDVARNRQANLWEAGCPTPNDWTPQRPCPVIDAILKAVRGVDAMLPAGIENWQKYNNTWSGHPLTVDAFWSDGADHGVNRNYAASSGDRFVMVVNGVLRQATFTAARAWHVDAIDPVSGVAVATAELYAGQTWTLPGRDDTMAGYIVLGTAR